MALTKFFTQAQWTAAPEIDLEVNEVLTGQLPVGTWYPVRSESLASAVISSAVSSLTISSVTQASAGADLLVTYAIDVDDSTVETVVFDAASPNPGVAGFGTDATTGYIDMGQVALTTVGTDISLTGPSLATGSYKIGFLPTGGLASDIVVTGAFTFTEGAAASSFAVTPLDVLTSDSVANPTNFTLDLSAFPSGGKLVISYGPLNYPTGVTFNGAAMTPVAGATNSGANGGGRVSSYEYDFSAGKASDAVVVTGANGAIAHALTAFVVEGGVIADSDTDWNQTPSTVSTALTVGDAQNVVVAAVVSNNTIDSAGYVGVTEFDSEVVANGAGSLATATNVATGALTVSADPDAATRLAIAAFVLEPT